MAAAIFAHLLVSSLFGLSLGFVVVIIHCIRAHLIDSDSLLWLETVWILVGNVLAGLHLVVSGAVLDERVGHRRIIGYHLTVVSLSYFHI